MTQCREKENDGKKPLSKKNLACLVSYSSGSRVSVQTLVGPGTGHVRDSSVPGRVGG